MLRNLVTSNVKAIKYCSKTMDNRFMKDVKHNREIAFMLGSHVGVPWYVDTKKVMYRDTYEGDIFDDINCSLRQLNDAPEVYVVYTWSESILGHNQEQLEEFAKDRSYNNFKSCVLLTCVIAVASIAFVSY